MSWFRQAESGIELLNANAQLRAAEGGRLVVDDGTGTERAIRPRLLGGSRAGEGGARREATGG